MYGLDTSTYLLEAYRLRMMELAARERLARGCPRPAPAWRAVASRLGHTLIALGRRLERLSQAGPTAPALAD